MQLESGRAGFEAQAVSPFRERRWAGIIRLIGSCGMATGWCASERRVGLRRAV